jgi:hypothetical protein
MKQLSSVKCLQIMIFKNMEQKDQTYRTHNWNADIAICAYTKLSALLLMHTCAQDSMQEIKMSEHWNNQNEMRNKECLHKDVKHKHVLKNEIHTYYENMSANNV